MIMEIEVISTSSSSSSSKLKPIAVASSPAAAAAEEQQLKKDREKEIKEQEQFEKDCQEAIDALLLLNTGRSPADDDSNHLDVDVDTAAASATVNHRRGIDDAPAIGMDEAGQGQAMLDPSPPLPPPTSSPKMRTKEVTFVDNAVKRGHSQVDQDTDDDDVDSGNGSSSSNDSSSSSSILSPGDHHDSVSSSSQPSRTTWKANKKLKKESLEMSMLKKKFRDRMLEVEDGDKHQYYHHGHPACHDDYCLPTRSPYALCNHSVHTKHPDTPRPGVHIRRRHLASRGDVHKAKRSLSGLFPQEVCLPPHLVDGSRKKRVPLMDITNCTARVSKSYNRKEKEKKLLKKAMKKFVPTTRTVPLWFHNTQLAEDITSCSSSSSASSSDTENTSSSGSDTASTSACSYNNQQQANMDTNMTNKQKRKTKRGKKNKTKSKYDMLMDVTSASSPSSDDNDDHSHSDATYFHKLHHYPIRPLSSRSKSFLLQMLRCQQEAIKLLSKSREPDECPASSYSDDCPVHPDVPLANLVYRYGQEAYRMVFCQMKNHYKTLARLQRDMIDVDETGPDGQILRPIESSAAAPDNRSILDVPPNSPEKCDNESSSPPNRRQLAPETLVERWERYCKRT